MDDETPTLGMGFAIDPQESFETLTRLENGMDRATAAIVAEAAKIEKATGGMLKLDSATASIKTFGAAATREAAAAAREMARAEKAGEALSRQLERQAAAFGKSREEMRRMKVETAAAAAEQQGLTELAQRLRSQEAALYAQEYAEARRASQEASAAAEEKAIAAQRAVAAAEAEARAIRDAAVAHQIFEAKVREGVRAMREMEAAQKAADKEAAAAAMRSQADAAARLAQEHMRLAAMVRGSQAAQQADADAAERLRMSTDPLYAATKRLNDEIAESTRLYYAGATGAEEYARQQQVLAGRLNALGETHDHVAGSNRRLSGALTQLSFQANDVVTMALSGAGAFQIFATQAGQVFQIVQMTEGGFKGLSRAVGAALLPFAPLIAAIAAAGAGLALFGRAVSKDVDTKAMIDGLGLTRAEMKRLENTSVTTGDVVKATFQVMAQRVGLDLSNMGKWFSDALDWMTKAGRVALAGLYSSFVGTFKAIGAIVRGVFAGKGLGEILGDIGEGYKQSFNDANDAMKQFGADVTKQIGSNKLAELRKQAEEIKKDRTPKTDRHAAQLAREAEATEAQIRNLYALADAYGVSGAAALMAEARVKAESAAIKKRADIEEAVARQIRLAVAERVSDAAKSTAAMRDQEATQRQVNDAVAAGLIPAEQASDMMRDRIADLPLLAALEAAQKVNDVKGAEAAAKALDDQREARERLTKAESDARLLSAMQGGKRRLAELQEELRLVGATDAARVRALATLRATQEVAANPDWAGQKGADYIAQQVEIAELTQQLADKQYRYNDALMFAADRWDLIARNVENAARGMANAFGETGRAIGDMAAIYANFHADRERLNVEHAERIRRAGNDEAALMRANTRYALASATSQIGAFGDMTEAAKGFFDERSKGYAALAAAEKAFRAIEFALSVRAMAQDMIETVQSVTNSATKATAEGTAGIAAQSKLPFPFNIVAMGATAAALVAAGVAIVGAIGGGGGNKLPQSNTGTGTVLGDSSAQSDSIKNAIDALKEVDTLTSNYARQMAASLRSIENQIGGLASLVVRSGDINANGEANLGFTPNIIGKVLGSIPLIGGLLGGLFGSRTDVVGSGVYGAAQTIGSIRNQGFDASYYSDLQKTKKFLGVVTGRSYSTQYSAADPTLENQFTLLLRQFNDAIVAAAGPLGAATADIQNRLNGFVVNLGKIDLKGLTGEEIQEKLTAVFGKAADEMANAAFPGMQQFQRVGEGLFETLVRVASTVDAVSGSLDLLGTSAQGMSVAAKVGLAEQFDSISDLTSAADAYFQAFYSQDEQAAARTAQMGKVFTSLGLTMPTTLAAFRQLVEAQNLTTAAGQATYATLLQLAPAFAELQEAMSGAKSAADIASERQDLERQLLELQGDTAALRAMQLGRLDASNRALQEQIWAIQDAQEAARAAEELAKAWGSVGDTIKAEIDRIRGLDNAGTGGNFATLMGQFNAANEAARAGDMDAAKSLPGLSQALLNIAAQVATSRQELDRVRAQTAASLEATNAAIATLAGTSPAQTDAALLAAVTTASAATAASADENAESLRMELAALRAEVAAMRASNDAGHAATANNTGTIVRVLDRVTSSSSGEAIATVQVG